MTAHTALRVPMVGSLFYTTSQFARAAATIPTSSDQKTRHQQIVKSVRRTHVVTMACVNLVLTPRKSVPRVFQENITEPTVELALRLGYLSYKTRSLFCSGCTCSLVSSIFFFTRRQIILVMLILILMLMLVLVLLMMTTWMPAT